MPQSPSPSALQYQRRFGAAIEQVRRNVATSASTASDKARVAPPTVSAKYSQWFNPDAPPPPAAPATPVQDRLAFRAILPSMTANEVAVATKGNLALLGTDAYSVFASKLPAESRMRKAIRSTVLPTVPYLGSCKFGEVVLDHSESCYSVLQFYIANFEANLDTSGTSEFYQLKSKDFGQMYFGVNVLVDRNGNALGFDRTRGDNAVAFKTSDLSAALYAIASASTGLTIEDLQAMAARHLKG